MSEKFCCVHIGRSTWQGPVEKAPRRAVLCASGQQVRALVEALPRYGMEYDPTVDTDYLAPKADGRWLKRDEALAALTPAPQPEGEMA